jgi:N-acyl-L-homoserine lactone synthetase
MIQHYTRMSAATQPRLFQSMHADRKRVFVDMLKWDVPHDGQFEKDQYDTDRADYLILRDTQSGEHCGSVRLLPTTGPHILGDVFPFLCDGKVPRGPRISEITRLVVSPGIPRRERQHTRNMLGRAMVEFAQGRGIEFYTAVCEIGFLTQLLASGWRIDPLGLPRDVNGSTIGAVLIHVEPESISKTSELWRHPGPALRFVESSPALAA